jgi:isoamylase
MADLTARNGGFSTSRGVPLPLGATVTPDGVNFSIFSKHATHVTLVLFKSGVYGPIAEIPLSPMVNKTGDIWHVEVSGLDHDTTRYCYKMDMVPNPNPDVYRFDPDAIVLDPYAKALSGASRWGIMYTRRGEEQAEVMTIRNRRGIIYKPSFDWGNVCRPDTPMEETVIYELHVRGYTQHESSGVEQKGTFMGLCEKIPYLKDLGVTAVELLPVYEFEETDVQFYDPETNAPLLNYWGYHPINFFAPKASYAVNGRNGAQVEEFKRMVSEFHKAGIEVILDVVFNHTAEGDEHGHTFNYRGIDNPTYYIINRQSGAYYNYSGCGNTVNCNNPVDRDMIIDALRYWVTEMHVDGFRFDLASILGRGQHGEVLASPPLIERIAYDPILADTKLIAEAWDAAGLYQVGSFPAWGRWAEWNGRFRDDVRSYVKGDADKVSALAQRIMGSPDIYLKSGRSPFHSINFVTSHDGFTLRDLVSYNEKHNWRNGEEGRDGDNNNLSWNCGVEGESDDPAIEELRLRQQKNFFFLLLIAEGVPMILAGDEFGRTQKGNNNAYCQDNEIGWVDWSLLEKNRGLHRFVKMMIRFRKTHRLLKFQEYIFTSSDKAKAEIHFHGVSQDSPDWSYHSRALGIQAKATKLKANHAEGYEVYLFIFTNTYWKDLEVELPELERGLKWYRNVDTSLDSPDDIPDAFEVLENQKSYRVAARSNVILSGK